MNAGIHTSNGRTYRLEISSYDRTASLLLSLVMLLAIAVFGLLLLWLAGKIYLTRLGPEYKWMDLRRGVILPPKPPPPGPTEETDLEPMAVTTVLQDIGKQVRETWRKKDGGWPVGPPPPPISDPLPPPPKSAWEFRLPDGLTLEAYTGLLGFFGMELGVVLPGGKVHYAYDLKQPKPGTRIGATEDEHRYYLTWREGDLQEADRVLLRRAGIDARSRFILKFLPSEAEAELRRLVQQRKEVDRRRTDTVRRTVFGVRKAGSHGFEFFVMEQSYR